MLSPKIILPYLITVNILLACKSKNLPDAGNSSPDQDSSISDADIPRDINAKSNPSRPSEDDGGIPGYSLVCGNYETGAGRMTKFPDGTYSNTDIDI
ncbi:MAG: hypothetical protein HQK54_13790, partial [Oligoflexales bacterium]|nr:hypothetical protein [Oligoflexales bacterium]